MSYIELVGTLFGLLSVYLASRAHILTWPTGIVNEFFLFLLFYQVQLYADMALQIFFFAVTVAGWYNWSRRGGNRSISRASNAEMRIMAVCLLAGTLAAGFLFSSVHLWLPGYFPKAAAYPFPDSFVMVASIIATLLLAQKKIENWFYWIMVNVAGAALYFYKGVYFLGMEYLIFLAMAFWGYAHWRRQLIHAQGVHTR